VRFTQSVEHAISVDEMRRQARRRLPRAVFDAIEGAAGDEITMRANREALEQIRLRPRALADVRSRDLSTTVLGQPVTMPVLLAPCGMARMADSEAELAVARSAQRAGTVFAISGASSYSLEDIAGAATGPLWYQLYLPPTRDGAAALIARVEDAGYPVLCVTVDTAVEITRERDVRNRLTLPIRPTPRLVLSGLSRPRWSKDFVLGKVGHGHSMHGFGRAVRTAYQNLADTIENLTPVTFDDLAWLRERWDGKLVVKGILRGDECERMLDLGVDGIVVSNHGGRTVDCVMATIDALPEVVEAVAGRAEVFVDGGVRRGTDVVKALALGARACLIGRPYMYGLGAGGEAGVDRVLGILRAELERAMALLGCATVADIDAGIVAQARSAATVTQLGA
jgi:isopentenyl diphosphate isomerase/L-lactate dehydrogenase-like FMN-dependent dehydrogenase